MTNASDEMTYKTGILRTEEDNDTSTITNSWLRSIETQKTDIIWPQFVKKLVQNSRKGITTSIVNCSIATAPAKHIR